MKWDRRAIVIGIVVPAVLVPLDGWVTHTSLITEYFGHGASDVAYNVVTAATFLLPCTLTTAFARSRPFLWGLLPAFVMEIASIVWNSVFAPTWVSAPTVLEQVAFIIVLWIVLSGICVLIRGGLRKRSDRLARIAEIEIKSANDGSWPPSPTNPS
jgi:hypothetical protein